MATTTRFMVGDRVRFLENGIQVPVGATGTVTETFYDSEAAAAIYGDDAPLYVEVDDWEFPGGNILVDDSLAAAVSSEVEPLEESE